MYAVFDLFDDMECLGYSDNYEELKKLADARIDDTDEECDIAYARVEDNGKFTLVPEHTVPRKSITEYDMYQTVFRKLEEISYGRLVCFCDQDKLTLESFAGNDDDYFIEANFDEEGRLETIEYFESDD